MKRHHTPTVISRRQTNMLFDGDRLEGLEVPDRNKVVTALAYILMQATGLTVEEIDDDEL